MALPGFAELKAVDISAYCKERDGIKYLPWARCKDLLHQHGAEEVYFVPQPGAKGSSLHYTELPFADKNGNINRCYETVIDVVIDGKHYEMRSPVMNGANPVKDNSMSQQRVWNSMCRSFVKAVAIYTGLGFDLWAASEAIEAEAEPHYSDNAEDITLAQKRLLTKITTLNKRGMTLAEIAEKIGMTEDELRARFSFYSMLYKTEKAIDELTEQAL